MHGSRTHRGPLERPTNDVEDRGVHRDPTIPGPRIAQRRLLCQAQTVTRASRHLPPGSLTTVVPNARICFWAEVAQSVEQRTENAWVPSSSLGLGTERAARSRIFVCGRSSVVERLLAKEKVVGSNPIARFVTNGNRMRQDP